MEDLKVSESPAKPMVGIVVAIAFGAIGLVWSLYSWMAGPNVQQAALQAAFPVLAVASVLGSGFGLLGNVLLLIGATLAILSHQNGCKTVRVASWSMLALVVILTGLSLVGVMNAPIYVRLDTPTRWSLVGGVIGGGVGGVIQWGLLLFFFRSKATKRRSEVMTNQEVLSVRV